MSEINKDTLKYGLSYIPLVAFFFHFTEKKISITFRKHLNYWMILFLVYVVWTIVLKVLFLYILMPLLIIAYIWLSLFLGYKAYNWDDIQVDILDDIEEKISDNIGKK